MAREIYVGEGKKRKPGRDTEWIRPKSPLLHPLLLPLSLIVMTIAPSLVKEKKGIGSEKCFQM